MYIKIECGSPCALTVKPKEKSPLLFGFGAGHSPFIPLTRFRILLLTFRLQFFRFLFLRLFFFDVVAIVVPTMNYIESPHPRALSVLLLPAPHRTHSPFSKKSLDPFHILRRI